MVEVYMKMTMARRSVALGQPGAMPAVGGTLWGERPGQQHGPRLGIGLQHRGEQRSGYAHSGTDQVEKIEQQMVRALGPVERQP